MRWLACLAHDPSKGLSFRHLRAHNLLVNPLCGPRVCARPLASCMALRSVHDLEFSFVIQNFAFRLCNRTYGGTAAKKRSWKDSNLQSQVNSVRNQMPYPFSHRINLHGKLRCAPLPRVAMLKEALGVQGCALRRVSWIFQHRLLRSPWSVKLIIN